MYYNKAKVEKSGNIENEEASFVLDLFQKFRQNSFAENEKIFITGNLNDLPDQIKKEFNKVDEADVQEYCDGIDTESVSYKFHNSLSGFRVGNQKEI